MGWCMPITGKPVPSLTCTKVIFPFLLTPDLEPSSHQSIFISDAKKGFVFRVSSVFPLDLTILPLPILSVPRGL